MMASNSIGTELDKLISDYEFQNHQLVKFIEHEDYLFGELETEINNKESEIRRLQEADIELENNTRQYQRQFLINKDNTESLKKTSQVLNEHVDAMTTKRDLTLSKIKHEMDENEKYLQKYKATWQRYKEVYDAIPLAQELKQQKTINEAIMKENQEKTEYLNKIKLRIQQMEGKSDLYKLNTNEFIVKIAKMRLESVSLEQEEERMKIEITKKLEDVSIQSVSDSDHGLDVSKFSDLNLQSTDNITTETNAMEESTSTITEEILNNASPEKGKIITSSSNNVLESQTPSTHSEQINNIQEREIIRAQSTVIRPESPQNTRPSLHISSRYPASGLYPTPKQCPVQRGPGIHRLASIKIPSSIQSPTVLQGISTAQKPFTQRAPAVQHPAQIKRPASIQSPSPRLERPEQIEQPVPIQRPVTIQRPVPIQRPVTIQRPVSMPQRARIQSSQPVSCRHELASTTQPPANKQQNVIQHERNNDTASPAKIIETPCVPECAEPSKQNSADTIVGSRINEFGTKQVESSAEKNDTIPTVAVSNTEDLLKEKVLHPDGSISYYLPMKGSPTPDCTDSSVQETEEKCKSPMDIEKRRKVLEDLMAKSPGVPENYLAPLKRPFTEVDESHQNKGNSIPMFGMSPCNSTKILNTGDADSTTCITTSKDDSLKKTGQDMIFGRTYQEPAFNLFPSFSGNPDMQDSQNHGNMFSFGSMAKSPKGDDMTNLSAFSQANKADSCETYCFNFGDNNGSKNVNQEPTSSFDAMFSFGSMPPSPPRESMFKFQMFDQTNNAEDGGNFSFNFGQTGNDEQSAEGTTNVMSMFGNGSNESEDDQSGFSLNFGKSFFKSPPHSFSFFK